MVEIEMFLDQDNIFVDSDGACASVIITININFDMLLSDRFQKTDIVKSFLQST